MVTAFVMEDFIPAASVDDTPQKTAALRDKDIHRQNFFATFEVAIDYELDESWRCQLCARGIDDFPLGKNIPNRAKYEWNIEACRNRNNDDWKNKQALKGVSKQAISDFLRTHEAKEIPVVAGVADNASVRLLKKVRKKRKDTVVMVVPIDEVFERLHEIHSETGHAGNQAVKNAVDRACLDIPERVVKAFRETCRVCSEANPRNKKKSKGAKKPIDSSQFRDRFQGDLIDMRSRSEKDVYSVEMKWIFALKDHFTRLVYLRALPSKEAKYVAYEAHHIFGLIGYPVVFQTDNGKEFVATIVTETLDLLRKRDPHCITVQGRPRKPQDQGSVERSNGMTKTVLEALQREEQISRAEQRIDSSVPTGWVYLLPQVRFFLKATTMMTVSLPIYLTHCFCIGHGKSEW